MIKKLILFTILAISIGAYSQTVHNWQFTASSGCFNNAPIGLTIPANYSLTNGCVLKFVCNS